MRIRPWSVGLPVGCALRAGDKAASAANAAVFTKNQFGLAALALRVVAPDAGQRAAFEKNGGADARPVLDGISANVEDDAHDQ